MKHIDPVLLDQRRAAIVAIDDIELYDRRSLDDSEAGSH
jgi:hypothetical protein